MILQHPFINITDPRGGRFLYMTECLFIHKWFNLEDGFRENVLTDNRDNRACDVSEKSLYTNVDDDSVLCTKRCFS